MSLEASLEQTTPIDQIGNSRPSRRLTKDSGISALAASMAIEGLRHPILLMPSGDLLKGGRRLAAAVELGWTTIAAKQVNTVEEAVEAIEEAKDESNVARTIEEWVELGLTIETLDHADEQHDYNQFIGAAVASSGSQYKRGRVIVQAARSQRRPKHVVDVARQALDAYDAGLMPLSTAYMRVKAAENAHPADVVADDDLPLVPVPSPAARSPRARRLREEWIRALSAKGATSDQISQRIGISVPGLKKICKDIGLEISADVALVKTQRRQVDPNRAIRVAADDLDALVWSLDQVDVTAIDLEQAKQYATQFARYARSINRMARKLKGVSQ